MIEIQTQRNCHPDGNARGLIVGASERLCYHQVMRIVRLPHPIPATSALQSPCESPLRRVTHSD